MHTGFEVPILQGGEALFKNHNVWYIMAGEHGFLAPSVFVVM